MIYYHGSTVEGQDVLKPYPTYYQQEPYIYFSANEVVSAFYIIKRDCLWYTYSFTPEGIPVYTESYKGALEEFYSGVRGCIYVCEGDFAASGQTGICVIAVSHKPVAVKDSITVEDCLEKLYSYKNEGRLIIRKFDELTHAQKIENEKMVLGAIRDLDLLSGTHPLSVFVKKRFPSLWTRALEEQESGNLYKRVLRATDPA